jgi:hypothetical protein
MLESESLLHLELPEAFPEFSLSGGMGTLEDASFRFSPDADREPDCH